MQERVFSPARDIDPGHPLMPCCSRERAGTEQAAPGKRLTNLFLALNCILLCLQGCSGTHDTSGNSTGVGSATFRIEWPGSASKADSGMAAGASAITSVDCSALGVATVSAVFTDGFGASVASGSWPCSAHAGRVDGIPEGSGYTITVTARDSSGTDLYRGQKPGILITAGQTTAVGTVSLELIGGGPLSAGISSPVGDQTVIVSQPINFQGSATGGTPPYTYQWTFAGGAADSGMQNPGYVSFSAPGTYTVTFTVTDAQQTTSSASVIITVNEQATPPSTADGSFVSTGAMNQQRVWNSATLLPNGKVLISGGALGTHSDGTADVVYATAELYDSSAGLFSFTGSLNTKRAWHTSDPGAPVTLLNNGLVLLSGGYDGSTSGYYASSELYDPASGSFLATGSMPYVSMHHSAIPLRDGRVLVATINFNRAAVYDTSTGTFSPTGDPQYSRLFHTATLLPNGKVLITGGSLNGQPLAASELFDPETETFSLTGSLAEARMLHRATLLHNGKVLITGGATSYSDSSGMKSSAELYDPSSGRFTSTGSMNYPRAVHTVTLLLGGKVLVAGNWTYLLESEIYDPATGIFTPDASMALSGYSRRATLMADGRVLISGGGASASELYVPSASPNDSTRPSNPSVSINEGAETTTSRKVTLTLSASDDTGVVGYSASERSTPPLAALMTWIPTVSARSYSGSAPLYLSTGSGVKTVHVWFKDAAGNVSSGTSDSITLAE